MPAQSRGSFDTGASIQLVFVSPDGLERGESANWEPPRAMRALSVIVILASVVIMVLRLLKAYRITAKFEMTRRDQNPGDATEITALFEMNQRD